MADLFRTSVVMCLFAFMLNMADVRSEQIPQVVEKFLDGNVVPFEDARSVVTDSGLEGMFGDMPVGTTQEVCSPHMICAILLYNENNEEILGPLMRSCTRCSEGFECVYGRKHSLRYFHTFVCKIRETTVPATATTWETTSNAESRTAAEETTSNPESTTSTQRRGFITDIHEL